MPGGYYSVTPLPTKEELESYYANNYYQDSTSVTYKSEYSEDEINQKKLRANLIFHSLEAQLKIDEASLLEVGCGEGFLLNAANELGCDIKGIDFSHHGIDKFFPDLAYKVQTGDAFNILDEYIQGRKSVDICVLQNVLEHVIEPEVLINKIKQIIKPDGVLIITVPNDYSAMQKKIIELNYSKNEYWFAPPDHLHYFNVDSLEAFVTDHGFEIVDSFGDFPIEMFLFHEGSNYAHDASKGKSAHNARITLDLLLAERGIKPYHNFCQSMTACGIGRNVTVLLKSTSIKA